MISKKTNINFDKTISDQTNYYKLCQNCGNFSHINENNIHCSVCGKKLIEKCPDCKTKIENPIAKFCVKCGTQILDKLV